MTAAVSRAHLVERAREAPSRRAAVAGLVLAVVGGVVVASGLLGGDPDRTWWAYHANFLFWAGLAQGMVVFAATQKAATQEAKAAILSARKGVESSSMNQERWRMLQDYFLEHTDG